MNPKWEKICNVSNVFFLIFYAFFWFHLGYFGWVQMLIGEKVFFWLGLGFSLIVMPAFCIFSMFFSNRLRKEQKYTEAFWIQFLPLKIFIISMKVSFFMLFVSWFFTD